MNAFREALKNTEYREPQDSTSVITIKVVDEVNKIIRHSRDFAIIYLPQGDNSHYYKYLRHNKANNSFSWEVRELSHYLDETVEWIRQNGLFEDLEDEYIKLKNVNHDQEKHSCAIYL